MKIKTISFFLIFLILFLGLSCSVPVSSSNNRSYVAGYSNKIYHFSVSSIPPDASIYLDGFYQGQTPKTIVVSDGAYDIEIKKDGYQTVREKFGLDTNDKYTYRLKRIKSFADPIKSEGISKKDIYYKYHIFSVPSGANIYLDGAYHGLTPRGINVSDGLHEIEIKKNGYQSYKEKIILDKNDNYTYVLKKEYWHDKKQEKFEISHNKTDNIPPKIIIYSHNISRGIKIIK
jgi:hypothetical protein